MICFEENVVKVQLNAAKICNSALLLMSSAHGIALLPACPVTYHIVRSFVTEHQ